MQKLLSDKKWLETNRAAILNILPETWTHIANLKGLAIGYQLKVLGLDWKSENEFGAIMVTLEKSGLLKRDGLLVRRANI